MATAAATKKSTSTTAAKKAEHPTVSIQHTYTRNNLF